MKFDAEKLNSTPILDVAMRLGLEIKKNKSLCFIHNEKTPSMNFNVKKNYFKCFGCGIAGSVIDLVQKYYNCTFLEACEWINSNFYGGSGIKTNSKYKHKNNLRKNSVIEKVIDYEVNRNILNILFLDSIGEQYLCNDRKLTLDIVKDKNIKSISNVDAFYKKLESRFSTDVLLNNGFLKLATDTGELKRTWFGNGIIFPFYNFQNNIQTFALRLYKPYMGLRYIYLKDAPISLYNENDLSEKQVGSNLYICEGIVDALSLNCMDFDAIALPGITTFKNHWYDLVSPFENYIVFDNEPNAQKEAVKLQEKMSKFLINAKVQKITKFNDINDMYVDYIERKVRDNEN